MKDSTYVLSVCSLRECGMIEISGSLKRFKNPRRGYVLKRKCILKRLALSMAVFPPPQLPLISEGFLICPVGSN